MNLFRILIITQVRHCITIVIQRKDYERRHVVHLISKVAKCQDHVLGTISLVPQLIQIAHRPQQRSRLKSYSFTLLLRIYLSMNFLNKKKCKSATFYYAKSKQSCVLLSRISSIPELWQHFRILVSTQKNSLKKSNRLKMIR